MDRSDLKPQLEAVVPGVFDAYHSLMSDDGMGLHTSSGSFYNHTLFGRDGSMSAKFVADFDHAVTAETIIALAALQGVEYDEKTQEEPGRIHHELRDFRTWRGSVAERMMFLPWHFIWGVKHKQLLTYFSQDSTADYIRLVHKYARHIDGSILLKTVTNHHGEKITVADSLFRAADWIMNKLGDTAIISDVRRNRLSLPFQTYQDSLTTYYFSDGRLADYRHAMSYVEVQAYSASALYDMAELFPDHHHAMEWRETARRMQSALLEKFWNKDLEFFYSAQDRIAKVDVPNVSAGWTLNTSLWQDVESKKRSSYIKPIVKRLFSEEFLTPVGLRTMSKDFAPALGEVVGYHSTEVVWPMFSFMVVEGLRRHRLYQLADQLENRILNGLNATGNFDEFFIVQRDGTVVLPDNNGPDGSLKVQMNPEKRIAFSIVPAMTMAKRASYPDQRLAPTSWQKELEAEIMKSIPHIERAEPAKALEAIGPVKRMKLRRWAGAWESTKYFWRETQRMKKQ